MDTLTFDLEHIFQELLTRMAEEGIFTKEAYDDLVDEVLEEKRELGEIDDDENIAEATEKLKYRWPEAETTLQSGHDKDILDQE